MKMPESRRGFTLIEVLVVIGIIAVLSAILYATFNEAREDSKNKSLISEIKEIQLALELYKAQNGQYPFVQQKVGFIGCGVLVLGDTASSSGSKVCYSPSLAHPYIVGLAPDYLSEFPSHFDSANAGCEITYTVASSTAEWYKITAENCYAAEDASEGIQPTDELARCPSSCSATYCGYDSSGDPVSYDANDESFYTSFSVYSLGGECS